MAKQRESGFEEPIHTKENIGKSYILSIGIDEYLHHRPLEKAVADARVFMQVMTDRYGFAQLCPPLYNADATQTKIRRAIGQCERLSEHDRLIIFYAGHGWYRPSAKLGYLVPTEAENDPNSDFIPLDFITNIFKSCAAKHILLVVDCCFGGSFGVERHIHQQVMTDKVIARLADKKSRMVLSSGGVEPVSDGLVGSNNSPFITPLVDILKENATPFTVVSEIFPELRKKTLWNTEQMPQYKVLQHLGHDDGELALQCTDLETPEEKQWKAVQLLNTAKAYDEFSEHYPNSSYREEALRLMEIAEDHEEWNKVPKTRTGIRNTYLKKFPKGLHAEEANRLLKALNEEDEPHNKPPIPPTPKTDHKPTPKQEPKSDPILKPAYIAPLQVDVPYNTPSFWEQYRLPIIGGAALLFLGFMLWSSGVFSPKPIINPNVEVKPSAVTDASNAGANNNSSNQAATNPASSSTNTQITPPKPAVTEVKKDEPPPQSTVSPSMQEPAMVKVQGGTFDMGDTFGDKEAGSDEKVHKVTVSTFYMGKYEVSQAEWIAVMGSNPSERKGNNLPVENVSWDMIQKFLTKLNEKTGKKYRLPTEAEWEYAAREGGKKVRFGNGKDIADPSEMNFDGSSSYKVSYSVVGKYNGKTEPVNNLMPNDLGLYNMSGNVWEWCSDKYGPYPTAPVTDPKGAAEGTDRVNRGGSWGSYPQYCRASYRSDNSPTLRDYALGFRLALSL